MRTLNATKVGLTLGLVIGLWHLTWAALVAAGWAQPAIDFIFRIHFIDLAVQIRPFDGTTAAMLVVLTGTIGFVVGFIFALVWNWLHGPQPSVTAGRGMSGEHA